MIVCFCFRPCQLDVFVEWLLCDDVLGESSELTTSASAFFDEKKTVDFRNSFFLSLCLILATSFINSLALFCFSPNQQLFLKNWWKYWKKRLETNSETFSFKFIFNVTFQGSDRSSVHFFLLSHKKIKSNLITVKMCEKCFVQTKNYSNRFYFPVVERNFTFTSISLKNTCIFSSKILMVGGGTAEKSQPIIFVLI